MKKRIFSIMDTGRKKTGIAIFCAVMIITLGTGFVFAANASDVAREPVNPSLPNVGTPTSEQLNNEAAPILINSSGVIFDDSIYRWPYHAMSITNVGDRPIINYTTMSLAFDKDGNPLELYWDALNVSADGQVGSIGTFPGGSHGIVVDIYPISPKSYYRIHEHGITDYDYSWLNDLPPEQKDRWIEYLTLFHGETRADENGGWILFYGWNQSTGEHIVENIITIVVQVTFDDGSVWVNPEFDYWLENYHMGQSIQLSVNVPSTNFTPPNREGRSGNIMRTVVDSDMGFLGYFEEYGLSISQGNIYYNGQLVREIVFYSNYETTGLFVFRSSDTGGNITIYVLIPDTEYAMRGSDIENYIRFDVVVDN